MTRLSLTTCFTTVAVLAALGPSPALARPDGPAILCKTYPDAALCAGTLPSCDTCHTSTWPAAWNDFGLELLAEVADHGGPFEVALPLALDAVAEADSDLDGLGNLDEIHAGTSPGDPLDAWIPCELAGEAGSAIRAPGGSAGDLPDGYDMEMSHRRAMILYCGRSPSFAEMADFRATAGSGAGSDDDGAAREASHRALHDAVTACLDGPYWRDDGVRRLADPRIRPLSAVGLDSPVGITIGDYEWDYRLFAYIMTGDRDIRDLLLADYHVEAAPDGTLQRVSGTFPSPIGGAGGQPLQVDQRAGMITTQWFLSINTMFSALPRTTAAQAYRAYVGFDIAKQQGLYPIADEPVDVDNRGVADAQCAVCHSTLDPLSYAFSEYRGIAGGNTGTYDPGRPAAVIPGWTDNQGALFGEPVGDVREWAEKAAGRDAFRREIVRTLFQHAVERRLTPDDEVELAAIWRALPEDGWSANRAIHRIVDTRAFGVR